jgi:hypothetical protein
MCSTSKEMTIKDVIYATEDVHIDILFCAYATAIFMQKNND